MERFTNLGDFSAADFWFCATRIVENVEFEMTSAIPDNFLFSFIEHAGEKMVLCTNMFCKALQGKGLNLHKTKRVLNKFHAAEINQKTSRNLFLLALWCSIEFFSVLLASSLCSQLFTLNFLFCTAKQRFGERYIISVLQSQFPVGEFTVHSA